MRVPSRLYAAVLAGAAALVLAALGAGPASAQITYTPCASSTEFACGHLTVPLDPSGATGGTLTLALRRHRAPVGEARSAIIALAGGPGQPALPFAEQFVELLGPVGATRDLIVFDQRGVGFSHALACHAFERPGLFHSIGAAVGACAAQLGPARAFFTTDDTVADIEAIRRAGGYEKLVLYGTSYGTKVAERYAQAYPEHVEALVLDSVVAPNGPDTLLRSTFAAIPGVLAATCAHGSCRGVTSDPAADLARVLAQARHGRLRGRAIDGRGRAHTTAITAEELLGVLVAGDLAPVLRAELVTADRAAARGDHAPLARLLATISAGGGEAEDVDAPLYFAATCEEQQFPWNRAASARTRLAEATDAARALPASVFAPFSAANALQAGDTQPCAAWPYTAPAPAPNNAPLPAVPTLILSGAMDLRTPTADARALAAQIPGSHLLVVPYTGHSVLGTEPAPCARDAMLAMFAGNPIKPCAAAAPPPELVPPPLPPLRLATLRPVGRYGGRVGRTLRAVALTLADIGRQLALRIEIDGEGALATALRTGGLRSGWANFGEGTLRLHDYGFVPGVTVTGSIASGSIQLQVGGGAATGTLHGAAHGALAGTLEGRAVLLPASAATTAAIVTANAKTSSNSRPGGAARLRPDGADGELGAGILPPRLRGLR
jgi:pimeloyl-ACP methyl ester carboxylesterase